MSDSYDDEPSDFEKIKSLEETVEKLRSVIAQSAPIPTRERLPEVGERVNVWRSGWTRWEIMRLTEDKVNWIDDFGNWEDVGIVSRWLPLPTAPQES